MHRLKGKEIKRFWQEFVAEALCVEGGNTLDLAKALIAENKAAFKREEKKDKKKKRNKKEEPGLQWDGELPLEVWHNILLYVPPFHLIKNIAPLCRSIHSLLQGMLTWFMKISIQSDFQILSIRRVILARCGSLSIFKQQSCQRDLEGFLCRKGSDSLD